MTKTHNEVFAFRAKALLQYDRQTIETYCLSELDVDKTFQRNFSII